MTFEKLVTLWKIWQRKYIEHCTVRVMLSFQKIFSKKLSWLEAVPGMKEAVPQGLSESLQPIWNMSSNWNLFRQFETCWLITKHVFKLLGSPKPSHLQAQWWPSLCYICMYIYTNDQCQRNCTSSNNTLQMGVIPEATIIFSLHMQWINLTEIHLQTKLHGVKIKL